jgi:hypothetical protein
MKGRLEGGGLDEHTKTGGKEGVDAAKAKTKKKGIWRALKKSGERAGNRLDNRRGRRIGKGWSGLDRGANRAMVRATRSGEGDRASKGEGGWLKNLRRYERYDCDTIAIRAIRDN